MNIGKSLKVIKVVDIIGVAIFLYYCKTTLLFTGQPILVHIAFVRILAYTEFGVYEAVP